MVEKSIWGVGHCFDKQLSQHLPNTKSQTSRSSGPAPRVWTVGLESVPQSLNNVRVWDRQHTHIEHLLSQPKHGRSAVLLRPVKRKVPKFVTKKWSEENDSDPQQTCGDRNSTLKFDDATLRPSKLSKPAMAFVGKMFDVPDKCRVLHLVQSEAVEVPVA